MDRAAGALAVVVAPQLSAVELYLPPVLRKLSALSPPHTIISLPVQTALWPISASGAVVVLVAVPLSVLGLDLPPVFKMLALSYPPQTIISPPLQTAV